MLTLFSQSCISEIWKKIRIMDFRSLDVTAVNVISVYPKVQQVLDGKIPVPEVAEFFITNYCSFCCPHCRCAKTHESKNSFINLHLFKKVIDELDAVGCKTIEFGGGGEPLEHPDILKILHYIKEKNLRCGIITNGYAMIDNHSLVDAILSVADWIRISLDAVSDETYQYVHGRKDLSYLLLKSALMSTSPPYPARKSTKIFSSDFVFSHSFKLLICALSS